MKVFKFSALDMFFTDCQKRLIGTGPCVDIKKTGQINRPTGVFIDTGLTGRLEGADLDSLIVVISFLRVTLNECCDLELFLDVTDVCTKNVDLAYHIYHG